MQKSAAAAEAAYKMNWHDETSFERLNFAIRFFRSLPPPPPPRSLSLSRSYRQGNNAVGRECTRLSFNPRTCSFKSLYICFCCCCLSFRSGTSDPHTHAHTHTHIYTHYSTLRFVTAFFSLSSIMDHILHNADYLYYYFRRKWNNFFLNLKLHSYLSLLWIRCSSNWHELKHQRIKGKGLNMDQ